MHLQSLHCSKFILLDLTYIVYPSLILFAHLGVPTLLFLPFPVSLVRWLGVFLQPFYLAFVHQVVIFLCVFPSVALKFWVLILLTVVIQVFAVLEIDPFFV